MPYEARRFELANQEFTGQNIKVMQIMAFLFPFLTALMNIGIVLVIWMGGLNAIQGDISIG